LGGPRSLSFERPSAGGGKGEGAISIYGGEEGKTLLLQKGKEVSSGKNLQKKVGEDQEASRSLRKASSKLRKIK